MNDKGLGWSYVISSLLPSLVFVTLTTFIFPDFVTKVSDQLQKVDLPGSPWLALVLLASWLAFVLYNSESLIVKFYEGYFFPKWRVLTWGQRRWHREHTKHANALSRLSKQPNLLEKAPELQRLRPWALAEMQLLELRAPWNEQHLLPTTLGNVLRASEIYAYERYGIDGLTLWPRLFEVFPEQFVADLEDQNNRFVFMLNSSLLTYLLAAICLYAALMRQLNRGFLAVPASYYLKIGIGLLVAGYLLYRVGVNVAEDYGLSIRTGFDLYRFDLLVKLRQPLPTTLMQERDTWEVLCEFLVAGDKFGDINFTYIHPDDDIRALGQAQAEPGKAKNAPRKTER